MSTLLERGTTGFPSPDDSAPDADVLEQDRRVIVHSVYVALAAAVMAVGSIVGLVVTLA